VRLLPIRFAKHPGMILVLALGASPSFAEKLVDPNSVAPEFRAAAEKRRAEQIKLMECNKKASQDKVLPRDRTLFVTSCLEK
jgi:hypothetical protein